MTLHEDGSHQQREDGIMLFPTQQPGKYQLHVICPRCLTWIASPPGVEFTIQMLDGDGSVWNLREEICLKPHQVERDFMEVQAGSTCGGWTGKFLTGKLVDNQRLLPTLIADLPEEFRDRLA